MKYLYLTIATLAVQMLLIEFSHAQCNKLFNVTGGGNYCEGGAGLSINLSGSRNSVTYQLRLNGTTIDTKVGNGSALTWLNQKGSGTYTVVASPCNTTMSGSAIILVDPLPLVFSVGGGGVACGTTASVTLSGSQTGVSYQLKMNGNDSGSSLEGTGQALSWSVNNNGTYTIVAAANLCQLTMNGSAAVSLSPSPVQFTLSGAGGYCEGEAIVIMLSGSEVGVDYLLKKDNIQTSNIITGTGNPIVWNTGAYSGTYTVFARRIDSPTCFTDMGNIVITTTPMPSLFTVGGGETACGTNSTVTLNASQSGVSYQLKLNGNDYGYPIPGTGSTLTWTVNTNGSYTVVGSAGSCEQTMSESATVSLWPNPAQFTLSGGGTYCDGESVTITLSGSEVGVNYQLRRDNLEIVTSVAGTGSPIVWNRGAYPGTYDVVATRPDSGPNTPTCFANMGSIVITTTPMPSGFMVSGSVTTCETSATVTLTGSEIGISYQLKVDGADSGSAIEGTGEVLSWLVNTNGTYTVVAITAANCERNMNGGASVWFSPTPIQFTLTGGGAYCQGESVAVTLSGSEVGVEYQLRIDNMSIMGSPLIGTGSPLVWERVAYGATYDVIATRVASGPNTRNCSANMGSIVMTTAPMPTLFTVSGGSDTGCQRNVNVILGGSQTGVSYQLKLNGNDSGSALEGTGQSLSWSVNTNGTYTIVATAGMCQLTMNGSATVSLSPSPVQFTLSGAGTYCEGEAIVITLSGSEVGVDYLLKKDNIQASNTIAGTGNPIVWNTGAYSGTYKVFARRADSSTCFTDMGNIVITTTPVPSVFTVGGGGTACGTNSTVTLNGSQSGASYQLKLNGNDFGSPIAGTGSTLTWAVNTNGSYTVVCSAGSCEQTMSGSATVSLWPNPTQFTLTGAGTYCDGESVTITLSGSEVGVNYQLRRDNLNVVSSVAGTGSPIVWKRSAYAGTYDVVGIRPDSGPNTPTCIVQMANSIVVTTRPPITVYSVSGHAYLCPGDGVVSLSGSQTGVIYQLQLNNADSGPAIDGTGGPLSWSNISLTGSYTVVAKREICQRMMGSNAYITVKSAPDLFTVTGGGTICSGSPTGFSVNLDGSQTGVTYQLKVNDLNTGSPVSGTGNALVWPNQSTAGIYTVVATLTSTGCPRSMTGNTTITIGSIPEVYQVTGGGTFCGNDAEGLTISLSNSQTTVSYQLKLNGVSLGEPVAGNGASLSWLHQTSEGTYSVAASELSSLCMSEMAGSAIIVIGQAPAATIAGSNVLNSDAVTLTANTGTGYTYQWKVDNEIIAGETAPTLSVSATGNYAVVVSHAGCFAESVGHFVTRKGEALYNGIITAMHWRTDAPYDVSGSDFRGTYQYHYDQKYQIKEAIFGTPNASFTSFSYNANDFRLSNMVYDPNGNILALKRFNHVGGKQNDFSYQYNTDLQAKKNNQLESIPGYASYQYDALGQMIGEDKSDLEANDQYVEYDVAGKVRKVYSDAAKTELKVEFIYDDRGFRLAKVNHATDRSTWYIRDASGNVISIYEQEGVIQEEGGVPVENTLPLDQKEIPIYGSAKLGTYYPGEDGSTTYEITDHLGNVRALIRDDVSTYTATMEDNGFAEYTNPRVQEMAFFKNLFETEVNDANMNHTLDDATIVTNPSRSAYLFWQDGVQDMDAENKAIGPAAALRVKPGDRIDLETWVRYRNETDYTNDVALLMLSQLLGSTFSGTGGFEGTSVAQTASTFESALGNGGFDADGADGTRPFAYLNFIIFDDNFQMVDAGWERVPLDAGFDPGEEGLSDQHRLVKLKNPVQVSERGYIYVWVSNESENVRVWFDDLKISHSEAILVQATDYGVWGDVIREKKTNEKVYRYGYQGQFSETDDQTERNHFSMRAYDPVTGRWMTDDPYGQFSSPYLYAHNNPINSVDRDGRVANFIIGAFIGGSVGAVFSIYDQMINEKKSFSDISWTRVGVSAGTGAIAGTGFGGLATAVTMSVGSEATDQILAHGSIKNPENLLIAAVAAPLGAGAGRVFHKALAKVGVVRMINSSITSRIKPVYQLVAGKTMPNGWIVRDAAKKKAKLSMIEGVSSVISSHSAITLKKMMHDESGQFIFHFTGDGLPDASIEVGEGEVIDWIGDEYYGNE